MLESYAPILNNKRAGHESMSIAEITNKIFEAPAMMIKCDPRYGKYMACCLMFNVSW
jgi:tubulin alpha